MRLFVDQGVLDHAAPTGEGRLHAEAQERQRRLCQNDARDVLRHLHDDRAEQVGQQMAEDDMAVFDADSPRRLDVLFLPQSERLQPTE